MNRVLSNFYCVNILVCTLMFCLFYLAGCGGPVSSAKQVEQFDKAGPFSSDSEMNSSILIKPHIGPYRVIPGDVLEIQMPVVLRILSSEISDWLKPVF